MESNNAAILVAYHSLTEDDINDLKQIKRYGLLIFLILIKYMLPISIGISNTMISSIINMLFLVMSIINCFSRKGIRF